MGPSRIDRLNARRAHERSLAARASVVAGVLAVLVLVPTLVSFGSQGGEVSTDDAAQRLLARQGGPPDASSSPGSTEGPGGTEAPAPVEAVGPEVVPINGAEGLFVPLGQLSIGRIGLVTPVYNGVHDAVLEQGVGHWPGTEGDVVLSGHRTTFLKPFHDLDLLQPGDVAILSTTDLGDPRSYEVVETLIVPESEYVDAVLTAVDGTGTDTLTMYACHPKGQRTHRIVVRARAVAAPASAEGVR